MEKYNEEEKKEKKEVERKEKQKGGRERRRGWGAGERGTLLNLASPDSLHSPKCCVLCSLFDFEHLTSSAGIPCPSHLPHLMKSLFHP